MCVGSKTFTIERYGGESELCEWSTEKNVCFRSSVFYAFIQFFVVACSLPKTIIPLIYCCITLLPYQTINIIHILWRRGRRKRWCSGMYVTPTLRELWGYIKYNLIYLGSHDNSIFSSLSLRMMEQGSRRDISKLSLSCL